MSGVTPFWYRPVKNPLAWLDHEKSGICVCVCHCREAGSDAVVHPSHVGLFHTANEKFGLLAANGTRPAFFA